MPSGRAGFPPDAAHHEADGAPRPRRDRSRSMVDGKSFAEREDRRSVLDAGIFLRRHHLDQKADRFARLFAQPVAALKKVECALQGLARTRKIRSHVRLPKDAPHAA